MDFVKLGKFALRATALCMLANLPAIAAEEAPATAAPQVAATATAEAALASAQSGETVVVVAGGGDVIVTAAELRQAMAVLTPALKRAVQRSPMSANNFAGDVITQKLLARRARAEGLDSDPEVAIRIAQATDSLLYALYLERHGAATVDPSLGERLARDEYRARPEKFKRDEQVHVRHILVKNCACGGEEAQTQARLKAESILARLKSGESFEEIARAESDDPGTARRGGDLGFFGRGKTVKPFEDAAFALTQPGELSGVVESEFGYHILRLEARHETGQQAFEEVRERLTAEKNVILQNEARARFIGSVAPVDSVAIDSAVLREVVGGIWEDESTVPTPAGAQGEENPAGEAAR
jgi:peptidyl-prolyl cis-trans isomerase C